MRQKAYLKSAVYVLLVAAVSVIPFALAQQNSSKRNSILASWQRPALSDLAGGGLAMRIPSLPASQLRAHASGPTGATPTPTPTPGLCQFQVVIVFADAVPPTQFQAEILAEPNVTTVDLFDASIATPTLDQLQPYDIVVSFGDTMFFDSDALGDNLADYVDGGGVVVQYGFSHAGPNDPAGINGRWLTDGYNPYHYSEDLEFNPFSLGAFDAGHPLMAGVTTLDSTSANIVRPNPGATEVAQNNLGESLVAFRPVGTQTTVGVTAYVGSAATEDGDWGKIVVNAGNWLLTCQASPTPTPTPTPSATPTATSSPTPSVTPSPTPSPTPSVTPTATPRATPAPRPRPTPHPRP